MRQTAPKVLGSCSASASSGFATPLWQRSSRARNHRAVKGVLFGNGQFSLVSETGNRRLLLASGSSPLPRSSFPANIPTPSHGP